MATSCPQNKKFKIKNKWFSINLLNGYYDPKSNYILCSDQEQLNDIVSQLKQKLEELNDSYYELDNNYDWMETPINTQVLFVNLDKIKVNFKNLQDFSSDDCGSIFLQNMNGTIQYVLYTTNNPYMKLADENIKEENLYLTHSEDITKLQKTTNVYYFTGKHKK